MAKKGPAAENAISAVYGSYVFFEKIPKKNIKPKTQHRLGMEDAWDGLVPSDLRDGARPGKNVKKILDRESYIMPVGHSVHQDVLGKAQGGW